MVLVKTQLDEFCEQENTREKRAFWRDQVNLLDVDTAATYVADKQHSAFEAKAEPKKQRSVAQKVSIFKLKLSEHRIWLL